MPTKKDDYSYFVVLVKFWYMYKVNKCHQMLPQTSVESFFVPAETENKRQQKANDLYNTKFQNKLIGKEIQFLKPVL